MTALTSEATKMTDKIKQLENRISELEAENKELRRLGGSPSKIGRWTGFERVSEKLGAIILTTEYKQKKKDFAFKVFNVDRINMIEKVFKNSKGQEIKSNFGLSELERYEGKLKFSTAICWNLGTAGGDPEKAEQKPDIQRSPVVDLEDDDSLPF